MAYKTDLDNGGNESFLNTCYVLSTKSLKSINSFNPHNYLIHYYFSFCTGRETKIKRSYANGKAGFKPRQPPTQGRPHYMENQYSKREGDPFILLLIWGVCLSSINDYIDADFKIFLQQYFLSPMQHESRVFLLMQILIQNI